MKKLEQTQDIMQRLFDPRIKSFNTYVRNDIKQLRKSMPHEVKMKYLENYLQEHWQEICGENLSKNCMADSLDNNVLTIRTTSSLFANELFMMKKLLLQKINKFFGGSWKVKEIKFYAGGTLKHKKKNAFPVDEYKDPVIGRCSLCGAKMLAEKNICSVCEREQRKDLYRKITDLLKNQPWLSYEECKKYIDCDNIGFNDAKDILKNYYFEKVRLGFADEMELYTAVMLLTGKTAEELDERIISSSLEFLRRNKDVFTSRV